MKNTDDMQLEEWLEHMSSINCKLSKDVIKSLREDLFDPLEAGAASVATITSKNMSKDHTFSLITSRIEDFDNMSFLKQRHLADVSTFEISGKGPIPATLHWQDWLVGYADKYTFLEGDDCIAYKRIKIEGQDESDVDYSKVRIRVFSRHRHLHYHISGCREHVLKCQEELRAVGFVQREVEINWVYGDSYREMESYNLPLKVPTPIEGAYPWLGSSVKEFVEGYLASTASITIFIGPPGTGKTTLIKEVLQELNCNAMVTYDSKLLFSDGFFAAFMTSTESDVLVIEDADEIMRPREEGNSLMHKLLNISDGLISLQHKKIIFTTNLPSVKEIDPALMRKGRCFATVHARKMTFEEASKFYSGIRPDRVLVEKRDYSLAELINDRELKAETFANPSKNIGFFGG